MANYSAQYVFGITADTKAAQTQLQQLSKSLRDIQTKRINLTVDDSRITQAAEAARLLQHELTKAMNVKTGQLDLSKLSQGLRAANTDVATLGRSLLSAGEQGQQAFSALIGTISATNAPVKQLNKTITNLGTTLMNTIKWQASSSLVHGLMSTISGAISYARNLNETLNNIQIVTGQNDAQMAKFATTANRMAKELSTTTNEFAKASLIYYQQGDSAELAAKKAAITTKAANVAFTANAQEMSEMLTAVWNSFQVGEDKLEHVVDVMAKLGATTASSMEEMATGMQKVAATANTVGVSMEQMSAIVATAASVTRQAPETIGTAWNTILSRIGGLKLGETLEDGVDLNKYSKALQTIGVNILDTNGELRDMGGVIDEIGSKWEHLTTAQQSALAQTVGGARQYTQILAFFDNFDKYQQNMKTALNSDGALQEQADTYAEGWEAASNRVRASMETLYSQIFDDKAIAKMTSFFAKVIDKVTFLTQSFGGIGNVVSLLATQLMQSNLDVFSTKLVEIGNNIKQVFSGSAEINDYASKINDLQQQMQSLMDIDNLSATSEVELSYDIQILEIKKQLAEQQGKLTQEQLKTAEATLKNLQQDKEYYTQLAKLQDQNSKAKKDAAVNTARQEQIKTMGRDMVGEQAYNQATGRDRAYVNRNLNFTEYATGLGESGQRALNLLDELGTKFGVLSDQDEEITLDTLNQTAEIAQTNLDKINNSLSYAADNFGTNATVWDSSTLIEGANQSEVYRNLLSGTEGNAAFDEAREQIEALQEKLASLGDNPPTARLNQIGKEIKEIFEDAATNAESDINKVNEAADKVNMRSAVEVIKKATSEMNSDTGNAVDAAKANLNQLQAEFQKSLSGASQAVQSFVTTAMALSRVTTAFSAVKNAWDTISDPDASAWTIVTTAISTLVTVGMAASSVMKALQTTTTLASVAAAKKARNDVLAAATSKTSAAAGTVQTAANVGIATSFRAAAAAAKAFWTSLGPIKWVVVALTAAVGLISVISSSISKHNEQIKQSKKEAVESYENIKTAQSKLITSYSDLNSILVDTNSTLSEQLTKINEITKAFGFQVTAADLAGESYEGLNNKLLAYARSQQNQNLTTAQQATETYSEITSTEETENRRAITNDWDMLKRWNDIFDYMAGNSDYDVVGNQARYQGKTDEAEYALEDLIEALHIDQEKLSEWEKTNLDILYNDGWFIDIGTITNFQNLRDTVNQSQLEEAFGLSEEGFQSLLDIGAFVANGTNMSGEQMYGLNFGRGAPTGRQISEALYGNIDQNLSDTNDKAIAEQQQILDDNVKVQQGILEVLNANKIDFVGSEDISVGAFRDLINSAKSADTYSAKEQIASYFKDLPVYDNAYAQYVGLGSLAGVVAQSSNNYGGLSQSEILDKLIDYENLNEDISVDTLLSIRPDAIKILPDSKNIVIDQSAIKLAELTVAADKLTVEAGKIDELKGIKSETLTVDEVQQAQESGIFTEEELAEFVVSGKNKRTEILNRKAQDNAEQQYQNNVESLAMNRLEQQQAKKDSIALQKSWEESGDTYFSISEGRKVNIRDYDTADTFSTDLALARTRRDIYTEATGLKGVKWDNDTEPTDTQKQIALNAYNLLHNTELTELDKEQFNSTVSDEQIKFYNDEASSMRDIITLLDPMVTAYDSLTHATQRLENEEKSLESDIKAYETWKTQVKDINDAKTAITQYQSLIGKNGKLTADELEQLKQLNTALYERYKNGELTNEQFDSDIREAEIAELEKLKTAYENAGQADEAFIAQQQIEAIQLEEQTAQLEKAKEAYSRYTNEVKKLETKTENMKTGATLLQDNVETGKLTAVQQVQFRQSGLNIDLEKYQNATSQTERAAIAAEAWGEYLNQAEQTLEKQNATYNEVIEHTEWRAKQAAEEGSTYLQDKYTSATKLINERFYDMSEKSKGLIMEAIDYVEKNGSKSLTEMTEGEVVQAIYEYCSTMKDENDDAYAIIAATGIDKMKSIWDSATAAEAAAARQTISDWESAFKTIAGLRKKILSNSVDEITTEEWLQGFLASDYQTAEEYNAALYSKDVDKFVLPVLTDDEILTALGIKTTWTEDGKVKNNLTGQQLLEGAKKDNPGSDDTAIREQTAKTIVQTLQDNATGLGLQTYTESDLKEAVDAWLTQGNSQILKIGDKEINVSNLLNKSVEAQKGVRDLNIMQNSKTEAKTTRDAAIDEAERLSSQAATNLEEMQNYANAAYDLAKDMGEKTVTETMKSYTMSNADFLSKINEIMGENYESIEEIPKDVLRNFASAMTESQYVGSESPLAQQVEAAKQEMDAQQAYINQLKESNPNYETTPDYNEQIEKLNELTTAYNEAKAAQDKMIDQDYQSYLESLAEDIDLNAKELEDYGNKMVEQGEVAEGLSQKEQAKYAKALYRQVQGFTTAKKNLKSYTEELKKSKGDVNAHTKALNDMRDMYSDVFDFDENQANRLSDAFLESAENAKLLEKAAAGDEEALDKLARNAADDFLSITENADSMIDLSGIQTTVENEMSSIQEWLDSHDLEAGATLDDAGFIAQCENLINQCAKTAQEASDALSAMGVDATIEEHTMTVPTSAKQTRIDNGYAEYAWYDASGALHTESIPLNAEVTTTEGGQEYKWYTIKGAKYKGTGVTHGGSSNSGNGSGGGGGKKSAKKVESMKRSSDNKERYHEITAKLGEQADVLTRLDKIKSRTFGADHVKAINDEISALEKETDLYAELAQEASANMSTNRTILEQYGATFNKDGTINYDEYMDKILQEYNDAVEKYNSSEQKAADKLDLERAKELYEEAKKAMEDYEEDMDKLNEAQENMLENQNKISAAMLEGIQYKVELKLDFNDRDIKLIQYFRDKWEELYYMQDEAMYGMITEADKYSQNLATLGIEMGELNAAYRSGTMNAADYATGMQDLNDKILEQLNNLNTAKKLIKEAYGNTLQAAEAEIQKYTAILDHSHSVMEQFIQMQQLMGLGADYSGLTKMYQTQYDSSIANVKAAKEYLETLKNSRAEIEKNVAEHGWTDTLKQQWEDVNSAIIKGEDDLLSKTQTALTDAQNMFNNTMQAIIQDFDNKLFDMKNGLAKLEDDYAYYQEEQSRYLSTSKELYEVSKLNREINESVAGAATKASKERLKALQEEINAKSKATQLTEYDVQMMELQYKYALALEDLEDAKNAKSVVRLTRDENGNYGYQYTADDDQINKTQQQVEDVLQQINELAAKRVSEIEQAAVQAERQYRDSLLEIAGDTTLTLEERQAKMEELTKRYAETMKYNQEQYGNATSALLTNQQYVYERYGVSIRDNTKKLQDQMNTSVAAMIERTADYGKFLQEQLAPGGAIREALDKYKDEIGIVANTSGLDSWEDMVASAESFEEANKLANEELTKINDTLGETLTNIADVTDSWSTQVVVLDSVIAAYEELANVAAQAVQATAGNLNGTNATASEGAATKDSEGTGEKQWMFAWGAEGFSGTWSGYDSESAARKGAVEDIRSKIMSTLEAGDTDEETAANRATLEAIVSRAINTIKISSYLHGGLVDYTGPAWVDGTKTQPELMLNSTDTANILRTVEIMRDIDIATINGLYDAINRSTLGMMYTLGGITAPNGNSAKETLEQNVQITAEFPNATDKDEIISAFDDLINIASQYANR